MADDTSVHDRATAGLSAVVSTYTDLRLQYSSTYHIHRALDQDYIIYEYEKLYSFFYFKGHVSRYLRQLHDLIWWNSIMCLLVLAAVVAVMLEDYKEPQPGLYLVYAVFNIHYALHVAGIAYVFYTGDTKMSVEDLVGFCVDLISFSHYLVASQRTVIVILYGSRLHRAFSYILYINDYYARSSVLGTAFKMSYITSVLRVVWTIIWMYSHEIFGKKTVLKDEGIERLIAINDSQRLDQERGNILSQMLRNITMSDFCRYFYAIDKMIIPFGTTADLSSDFERVLCALVMVSGCLMLAGATIATMSLVFSIHMMPEEVFRARYRLIMKELEHSKVSPVLQEKVKTFYTIYWQKQNAVSTAFLLAHLPPSLVAAINYDIYFMAMQKSRILRDLPNHVLTEVAKVMTTIHYIPGDTIIGRGSKKSSMYYITYGDIEMLTAEDDSTPILRMARGSVVTACSGCSVVGCGRAHVALRAATAATAQVLSTVDLWKKVLRQGRYKGKAAYVVWPFYEHLERVKMHYETRVHQEVPYLSSILHFKHGLISLKKAKDEDGKLLLPQPDVFLEIAGCYRTRSQLENAQVEEADAICLRQRFPCILQPASSLLSVWHAFLAALTLTVCVVHPYYLTFKETVPLDFWFFNHVVTIVYIVDLIVYLSTGANIEEGVAITFTQTASQQMQRGWFIIDVLATIPIFEFVGNGHFAGMNKLFKLPKVFHILKMVEDSCVYHAHVLRFCIYTLLLCILCYLMAAFKQGFDCFHLNNCEVKNFTHPPHWQKAPLDDSTIREKITFGLYWSISLLSLTSHMDKYSFASLMYNVFILELVLVLHIFIVSVYSATIMVTSEMRQNFDMFISSVKEFLIRNSVDPQLRKRFITYLELCWLTDQAYSITHQRTSIFFDLPPHVSQDIIAKQCSSFILTLPFMKFLSEEDLKSISYLSKLFYTSPGEVLLHTGNYSDELCVIKKGICEVLCPVTGKRVRLLSSRSHFGILGCLLRFPAYYTIRAVTHVEIISVRRRFLENVDCLQLPQIKYALEEVKGAPEFESLRQHVHQPFVEYQPPPEPPNRSIFQQRRKYESDSEFLEPFTRIGFLSVLRYVFPRFTLRPDGAYVRRYEWVRALCALAAALVTPSQTYLRLQLPALHALASVLDITAYFDIIQRMIVGYYNEKGILVYHPASTSTHYLRGAFIVDLMGCLPLEDMQPRVRHGNVYTLLPLRQFLTLNRLLQLYRFFYTIDTLSVYMRKDIMLVLKALPLFTTMCNVLTLCIVLSSVKISYVRNLDQSRNYTISTNNDSGGNWIHIFKDAYRFNLTENLWNLHLGTYFWVIYETTTTGYKTINPTNFRIMEILFIGMVTSSMLVTYFSVRVISDRANVNKALCTFQEHKKDMHNFMEREMLDAMLKKQVYDHYDYSWDQMGGVETHALLKLCDQVSLRTDIILDIYGDTFIECPILMQHDMSLLRVFARGIRDAHFVRGAPVVGRDDVIAHMYLVNRGIVLIRGDEQRPSLKLGRGSVFGNLERAASRSPQTAVARTNVHLLQLESAHVYHLINDFPDVQRLMDKYRPKGEMYIVSDPKNIVPLKKHEKKPVGVFVETIKRKYNTDVTYINPTLTAITYLTLVGELYNIGFQNNQPYMLVFLYILDVLFSLKVFAMIHIPKPKLKMLIILRSQYVKKTIFKCDVVSLLPIEVFSLLVKNNRWFAYSWLRVNRLLRILTLYKCMVRKRKRLSVNLALSTMFSVFVWFTLFVHAVSCLFYYIGSWEDYKQPASSWKYSSNGTMSCRNHYVCAVFFILSSFIHNGLGDVMPKKHSEVILVALLAILSTMVLMIYVGEVSNIVQYHSFRSFNFYSNYLQLNTYLKNNRVSPHLVSVVKKYCLHLWRESRGYQMPFFLKIAPQPLRLHVMNAAYHRHLARHPVFKNCELAFLRQLTGCFKLYTYNDELPIVQENEITDAMYFIHRGSVLEYSELHDFIQLYEEKDYFGEFQGLFHNKPFENSYKSVHKSQILILYLNDWEYLLQHFPESEAVIYGRKYYDYGNPRGHKSGIFVSSDLELSKGTDFYKMDSSLSFDISDPYLSKNDDSTTSLTPTVVATKNEISKNLMKLRDLSLLSIYSSRGITASNVSNTSTIELSSFPVLTEAVIEKNAADRSRTFESISVNDLVKTTSSKEKRVIKDDHEIVTTVNEEIKIPTTLEFIDEKNQDVKGEQENENKDLVERKNSVERELSLYDSEVEIRTVDQTEESLHQESLEPKDIKSVKDDVLSSKPSNVIESIGRISEPLNTAQPASIKEISWSDSFDHVDAGPSNLANKSIRDENVMKDVKIHAIDQTDKNLNQEPLELEDMKKSKDILSPKQNAPPKLRSIMLKSPEPQQSPNSPKPQLSFDEKIIMSDSIVVDTDAKLTISGNKSVHDKNQIDEILNQKPLEPQGERSIKDVLLSPKQNDAPEPSSLISVAPETVQSASVEETTLSESFVVDKNQRQAKAGPSNEANENVQKKVSREPTVGKTTSILSINKEVEENTSLVADTAIFKVEQGPSSLNDEKVKDLDEIEKVEFKKNTGDEVKQDNSLEPLPETMENNEDTDKDKEVSKDDKDK